MRKRSFPLTKSGHDFQADRSHHFHEAPIAVQHRQLGIDACEGEGEVAMRARFDQPCDRRFLVAGERELDG